MKDSNCTEAGSSTANKPNADAAQTVGFVERLPVEGRLGGIDFGTVRMGLATCDPSQTWVTPFDTYNRRDEKHDREFLSALANSEALVGWVIGLPIHCDGQESEKSREVREFAQWLHHATCLPYLFFDERFTTAEARRLLRDTGLSHQKRKKQLDRLAAHLILTHYIESSRKGASQNEALEDAPHPS